MSPSARIYELEDELLALDRQALEKLRVELAPDADYFSLEKTIARRWSESAQGAAYAAALERELDETRLRLSFV